MFVALLAHPIPPTRQAPQAHLRSPLPSVAWCQQSRVSPGRKADGNLGMVVGGDESRQRGIVSGYETSRRQQAMEKGNIPGRAMENMILGTVCGAGLETETGKA